MKAKVKRYLVVLMIAIIAAYAAYAAFYYKINSFVFYAINRPPVTWKNVTFNFSIGMKFVISDQWVQIFYYGKEKEGSVLIELCKPFDNNDSVIDFMRKRKDSYVMTSYRETSFNSMPALYVNAIDKETGYYLEAYYLTDKGLIVSFYGPKEKYNKYRYTVDSIVVGRQ